MSAVRGPELIPLGGKKWLLNETWTVWDRRNQCQIKIGAGFVFDGSSSPRLAWGFISPWDLGAVPALVHDWLYSVKGRPRFGTVTPYRHYSRAEADQLFRDLMNEDKNVAKWRRVIAYPIVRVFGGLWGWN